MSDNNLTKLLKQHNGIDLIVENEDWDKHITPGLCVLGLAMDSRQLDYNELAVVLRSLLEVVYQLGHKRGRQSIEMSFTVKED